MDLFQEQIVSQSCCVILHPAFIRLQLHQADLHVRGMSPQYLTVILRVSDNYDNVQAIPARVLSRYQCHKLDYLPYDDEFCLYVRGKPNGPCNVITFSYVYAAELFSYVHAGLNFSQREKTRKEERDTEKRRKKARKNRVRMKRSQRYKQKSRDRVKTTGEERQNAIIQREQKRVDLTTPIYSISILLVCSWRPGTVWHKSIWCCNIHKCTTVR